MKAADDIIDKNTYDGYLSMLLVGNHLRCSEIVDTAMAAKIPVKEIYQRLFQRSLYKVGELWEYNRISVAVEHLATAVTEGLMNRMYAKIISPNRKGKKAVITSAENELHQVGGKMVADIFEMNGWDSYYLGANTPVHELIRFVGETKPDVVGISLSVYSHLAYLARMIANIRKEFPTLRIIIGGQAFRHGGRVARKAFPTVELILSLDELEEWIKRSAQHYQ